MLRVLGDRHSSFVNVLHFKLEGVRSVVIVHLQCETLTSTASITVWIYLLGMYGLSILTQWTVINIFHGLSDTWSWAESGHQRWRMSRKSAAYYYCVWTGIIVILLLLNLDIAFRIHIKLTKITSIFYASRLHSPHMCCTHCLMHKRSMLKTVMFVVIPLNGEPVSWWRSDEQWTHVDDHSVTES